MYLRRVLVATGGGLPWQQGQPDLRRYMRDRHPHRRLTRPAAGESAGRQAVSKTYVNGYPSEDCGRTYLSSERCSPQQPSTAL